MLEVSQNDFSYWNKGNCKYLTGSQHQICGFLRVLLPMCIHTIWYLSWLSKTPWENGSVYPRKRLQARILQLRPDCICPQRKLTKERRGRGMDFSKNSNHESNSLQFTMENIILLPCQELWICKILLVFRQGPTLDDLQLSMQHWPELLHWAHIKGQSSVRQLFTCESGAVSQCLQPLPAFTASLKIFSLPLKIL